MFEVADTVIDCSKGAYQELEEKRDYIRNIIKKEEERFDATIDNGLNVLNGYIEAAQKEGRKELTGKEAFKLHDTYGFPVDLTIEMAEEKGLEVDVDGFNKAMQEQKDTKGRSAPKAQAGTATKHLNLKMQSRLYLSVTIHLKQTQKL